MELAEAGIGIYRGKRARDCRRANGTSCSRAMRAGQRMFLSRNRVAPELEGSGHAGDARFFALCQGLRFGIVRISISRSKASAAPAACPRSSAGFPRIPDVTLARVNLTDRRVALEWKQGALDPARFIDRLAELGYKAYPFEPVRAEAQRGANRRASCCAASASLPLPP